MSARRMSSACESEPIAAVLCAGQPRKPHIALCLGGAARTFVQPLVHRSIYEHVIRALGANVVVFACLSSEDAKPWKAVPAIHHNRSRVDAALRAIGVPAHQAHVDEAGCEASSGAFARCANYTAHPEAPPDGMFGKTLFSKDYLRSFVGQLERKRLCMARVEAHERRHRLEFSAVLYARPDLTWYGPLLPWCYMDWTQPVRKSDLTYLITLTLTLTKPLTLALAL